MQMEPETKMVQTHFGSQPGLKSREVVETLTSQAKGIQELVVDRFNDVAHACQPATQRFRPADPLAALMGCGDQIHLVLGLPALSWLLSGKAFISNRAALSRQTSAWQTRRWRLSCGKQGRGQALIMRAGRTKAKASHDSQSSDTQQQMKAFVPAHPIAPATIHYQLDQPTSPSPVVWRHG